MAGNRRSEGRVLVALGASVPGVWGRPAATVARGARELEGPGTRVLAVSALYETAALGGRAGEVHVNAVAVLATSLPPEAILRRLKRLERRAGPRSARPWGPRALDLDLLDYKGRAIGWRGGAPADPGRRWPGDLVLPHPRLHRRPFVVRPLLDVAPGWRHPVSRRTAAELWRAARWWRAGRVLRRIADAPGHCRPAAGLPSV